MVIDNYTNPDTNESEVGVQEEWTETDQLELEKELQRLKYDSQYEPKDYPPMLDTDGKKIPIYRANNFLMILGIIDNVRKGRQFEPLSFEGAYAEVLEERDYDKISIELETDFPALYKKSMMLYKTLYQDRVRPEPDSELAKEFEQRRSDGYGVAAQIARSIDPNYPLEYLYR